MFSAILCLIHDSDLNSKPDSDYRLSSWLFPSSSEYLPVSTNSIVLPFFTGGNYVVSTVFHLLHQKNTKRSVCFLRAPLQCRKKQRSLAVSANLPYTEVSPILTRNLSLLFALLCAYLVKFHAGELVVEWLSGLNIFLCSSR